MRDVRQERRHHPAQRGVILHIQDARAIRCQQR
jgi:hypothetical protein